MAKPRFLFDLLALREIVGEPLRKGDDSPLIWATQEGIPRIWGQRIVIRYKHPTISC